MFLDIRLTLQEADGKNQVNEQVGTLALHKAGRKLMRGVIL